jgi:beta-glucosidase
MSNPTQFQSVKSPFLWGAATSSHQIEGHNEKNDWWAWEAEGNIEGGARSGAATDHWHRFEEDIGLAASLGLNSYRFSVEWSRLEPEEGKWDQEAFAWYRKMIHECEKRGLLPMLTLHHFTSPQWFAAKGGFTWDHSPAKFAEFTSRVVKELGAHIPLWCTLNEPMVLVAGTYLGKFMPPAQFSPNHAAQACKNLLKSHVAAYQIIHSEIKDRKGPWKDHPIGVGIAHNILHFMPDRKWHPLENLLAKVIHGFYNRSWLDAVTGRKQRFGVPFLIPQAAKVPEALGRKTCDFIGVNYYTKAYIQWHPRAPQNERPRELPIGITFARRREPVSDLGWAVYPKGFGKTLRFVAQYGLPIYITENGIADKGDALRTNYLVTHLQEIAKAIEAGMDIRGYYHWSLLDNFEWIKGFGPRFGLYKVDYKTFERTATQSALVFKKIIQAHSQTGDLHPKAEFLQNY